MTLLEHGHICQRLNCQTPLFGIQHQIALPSTILPPLFNVFSGLIPVAHPQWIVIPTHHQPHVVSIHLQYMLQLIHLDLFGPMLMLLLLRRGLMTQTDVGHLGHEV